MTNAINYVNCMLIDFASENDLELYLKSRDEIMTSELYDRLAAAGLKRQVVSKVWNKDQFRISVIFEYSSKDAYEKCRTIFGELERSEFMNKFAVKFQNNRGVVISEFEAYPATTPMRNPNVDWHYHQLHTNRFSIGK